MTERVILKNSEGNKKPGALGYRICSISKRENFSIAVSECEAEALTMGQLGEAEEARQELEEERRPFAQRHWTEA